jgi:hypothetical protein
MLLALVALSLVAFPALAQDDRTELSRDFSVVIPADWDEAGNEFGGAYFTKGEANLVIYDPVMIDRAIRGAVPTDLTDAAIALMADTNGVDLEPDWLVADRVAGKEAVRWDYVITDDDSLEGSYFFARWDEESYFAVDMWGPKTDTDDNLAAVRVSYLPQLPG